MRKIGTVLLGAALSLSFAALFCGAGFAAEDDPEIDGKPLSELLKQLRGVNRGFQLRAAKALAAAPETARAQVIAAVLPVLKSDRDNDRFAAAQILGEFGSQAKAAIPDLLTMLEGTQFERNRAAAAKALGQILKDAEPSDEVDKIANALARKFDEDYDKYSDVRREAVYALGMIGPAARKIIPRLVKALKDYPDGREEFQLVRRAAAWTCGRMGPLAAEHVDQLIAMLMSEGGEGGIPEYAEALGLIGPLKDEVATKNVVLNIVEELETLSNHNWSQNMSGWPYGKAAMQALQRFGDKAAPAVSFLTRLVPEKPGNPGQRRVVVIESIRTLGTIGLAAEEARPRLEAWAAWSKDKADELELHEAAKRALATIKGEKE